MYSDIRPLYVNGLVLFHKDCETTHGLNNAFGKCSLVRRHGVSGLVPAMDKSGFHDYTTPKGLETGKNVGLNVEKRLWHSGMNLHLMTLKDTLKKTNLTHKHVVIVEHGTLHDPTVFEAITELNCGPDREKENRPLISYVAGAWAYGKELDRQVVQENVDVAGTQMSKARARDGTHFQFQATVLQDSRTTGRQGTTECRPEPKIDLSAYKLTCPNLITDELQLLQGTVDQGVDLGKCAVEDPARAGCMLSWQDMRKMHEDEFCPSGKVWSGNKRPGDVETSEKKPSVKKLAPDESGVDESQLNKLAPSVAEFSVHTDSDGLAWIKSVAANSYKDEVLWTVKGGYVFAADAVKAKSKAQELWIPYELTADTLVLVTQDADSKQKKDLAIPTGRNKLGDLLKHLHGQGESGITMPMHKIQPTPDGTFLISKNGDACYLLSPKTTMGPGNVPQDKFGALVDYSKLIHAAPVTSLMYIPDKKLMKPWNPVMCFEVASECEEGKMTRV